MATRKYSQKAKQISTVISFAALFIFSLAKAWQTVNNLQVLGKKDDHGREEATVSRVIDGDTIELSDGRKIRYIGVDTPETQHPVKGQECFGEEAKKFNQKLVAGKRVKLEQDVSDTDRYGRILRYVWLGEEMVNEVLVKQGYAYAASYPPDVKYQDKFRTAQDEARQTNAGLWGACETVNLDEINARLDEAEANLAVGEQRIDKVKSECLIKGNISQQGNLYHLPDCPSYDSVVINEAQGEKWFCSEDEAQAAGWEKASNCP